MSDALVRRLGFLSILLGLASLALMAISVWGFRTAGWPWPQAFHRTGWDAWAPGAGVVLGVAGLVAWLRQRRGGVDAVLFGLILSLPVAGIGVAFEISARTTPPINDFSTDTEVPPVFWFTATPSDYPARNAEPQSPAYPDVRSLDLPLQVDAAFAATLSLVEERGWEVLSADPAESQIEAIARSRLFGFEDEVAIRVTETGTWTRADMRSRSRLGQIDRGANARRIEAFLADLQPRARN